jgi:hypothetical protein
MNLSVRARDVLRVVFLPALADRKEQVTVATEDEP